MIPTWEKELPLAEVVSIYMIGTYNNVWDAVVCDGIYYFKNLQAKRTQAMFRVKAKHKLLLGGRQLFAKPMDMYGVLRYIDADAWLSCKEFGLRYCGAKYLKKFDRWDYSGSSNEKEFAEKLKTYLYLGEGMSREELLAILIGGKRFRHKSWCPEEWNSYNIDTGEFENGTLTMLYLSSIFIGDPTEWELAPEYRVNGGVFDSIQEGIDNAIARDEFPITIERL